MKKEIKGCLISAIDLYHRSILTVGLNVYGPKSDRSEAPVSVCRDSSGRRLRHPAVSRRRPVASGSSRLHEHDGGHGLLNLRLIRENRREKYFGGPAVFLQVPVTLAACCFESGCIVVLFLVWCLGSEEEYSSAGASRLVCWATRDHSKGILIKLLNCKYFYF